MKNKALFHNCILRASVRPGRAEHFQILLKSQGIWCYMTSNISKKIKSSSGVFLKGIIAYSTRNFTSFSVNYARYCNFDHETFY